MTEKELRELIDERAQQLSVATAQVEGLSSLLVWKLVKESAPPLKFSGATKTSVEKWFAVADDLWLHLAAMQKVVADARDHSNNLPMLGKAARIEEVADGLRKCKISWHSGEQLKFVDAVARLSVTVKQIDDSFQSIEKLWEEKGRELLAAQEAGSQAAAELLTLESTDSEELTRLQAKIVELRQLLKFNPLEFPASVLKHLEPELAAVRMQLQRAKSEWQDFLDSGKTARQQLETLRRLRQEYCKLLAEHKDFPEPPKTKHLDALVENLETLLAQKNYQRAREAVLVWRDSRGDVLGSLRALIANLKAKCGLK